ncbi:ABC transporter permease [Sinosporangium siamense]|uniref:ABC transmembrane type-2 domain-containing protein n=1 Tax=Sinosporangium siamense TaxID=1367973 RepID=A0A919RBL1_9ACTN|nr:ABC transporter permease [Sinosporangium siamense]GII90668.1 hypothetical protein Ssi02_08990 [Sinosporangium siamense]
MRAITIILFKDLAQRARDSTLFVFAIGLPLGMAFVLNLILGGGGNSFTAKYALVDADRGPIAQVFTEQVLVPLEKQGTLSLRRVATAEEAGRLTESQEVQAAFVLPAGFSAGVQAGAPATIQVVGSVDAPVAVQVAREIGEAFATDLRSVQLAVTVAGGATLTQEQREQIAERARTVAAPLSVRDDSNVATRELDTTTFYAAGMAMFFLFFSVVFSVTSLFDERRSGTLARLLAAPIPRSAILAGKLLSGVLVGIVSTAILVVASSLLMGARWGDPLGVGILIVAAVLAATGMMAAVATFARTSEQASNWQSVIAMILGMLGGVFFPVANLGSLATITFATPHGWFLRGLSDLAGGGSLSAILVPTLALLAFAVVGFAMALLRVGRMLQS